MKNRLLCFCLTVCAAILFVSAAFAADWEGAAAIRITEQKFTDNTRSFTVNLNAETLRGSLFVAVYAQNGRMKRVEEYPASAATPVTLRNVADTDSVKAIWLDETYTPLAQSEVRKALEIDAQTQDEFASAILNMIQAQAVSGQSVDTSDEYALGRLIVRSDAALPD